ncbi:MAG: glycosyltransferase [Candidatus Scalindua rubra]|uniref:Glycosyltransferase n=1 Tax=Candidatus Scalindua rubra TaxID=1872076 RepID=A0A1E3XG49_9BACT|nr:MAG: glycosyltransferase [Candidatus Scalindua rubra]
MAETRNSFGVLWTIGRNQMYPSITGGQLIVSKHYEYLKEKGVDVDILENHSVSNENIWLWSLSNLWYLRQFLRYAGKIIVENNTHRNYFFLANWLIRLVKRVKIVVFAIEIYDYDTMSKWKAWLSWLLFFSFYRTADRIIVLSHSSKDWVACHKVDQNRIIVIPPSAQSLNRHISPIVEIQEEEVRILCVSHIRHDKGQEYLIKALPCMNYKHFAVFFVGLVKEEMYLKKLYELIEGYNLGDRINFTGRLVGDELARVYAKATVFVFPTLREAYGMVIHEAMSFGLPIIASDVGGIPEIITDGADGILVPPADYRTLASALDHVIYNQVLRKKLRQNAYLKSRELPSWDDGCEQFYNEVAGLSRNG